LCMFPMPQRGETSMQWVHIFDDLVYVAAPLIVVAIWLVMWA
jgi:hypothetical protein